jgi:uncharacterized protein YukE
MGQVQVSVPELRALGADVIAHAATLRGAVTAAAPRLAPGGGAGWATVQQATAAAHGWSGFLTALAGRVDAAGHALVSTADLYQAADERAAGRLGPR